MGWTFELKQKRVEGLSLHMAGPSCRADFVGSKHRIKRATWRDLPDLQGRR